MNYLSFIGGAALALAVTGRPVHRGVKVAAVDSTYTLHGYVAGLDTGWAFLYHPGDGPIDSVIISHGVFIFSGSVHSPQFCHLMFRKPNRDEIYSMGFFLQAGALELKGKKDSLSSAVVSGAPIQEEYLQYSKKENSVVDSLQKQLAKDYAMAHPSSYVAVYEVLSYFSYNPDAEELQTLYNGFTPEIQSSHLGTELKEVLDAALLTGVGRPAPLFTQADTKGRHVALSSLKGQYVLVDFWASWCGPCRAENPNVLKSYRAYHSKGFTVLGVSLDDQKSPWLAAIKKDGLPWMEVSDLKGWKNSAAVLYGVEGIPMNFLLDKNGTIVAKGLRGDNLEKKLAEYLH